MSCTVTITWNCSACDEEQNIVRSPSSLPLVIHDHSLPAGWSWVKGMAVCGKHRVTVEDDIAESAEHVANMILDPLGYTTFPKGGTLRTEDTVHKNTPTTAGIDQSPKIGTPSTAPPIRTDSQFP